VLAETERLIASGREHEEVVYWAGIEGVETSTVVTCIAPRAATTYGSFDTTAASNAVVINWIADHGLVLLGQLHCHPDHRVWHSGGDDRGALMPYENFLSIVVPHYGQTGIGDFQTSGVHRYEGGRFIRLTAAQVAQTLVTVPTTEDFRGPEHADPS
jgi:proteasome lid subunit RPN8/RPN11